MAIRVELCGPLGVEVEGRRVEDALPGRQGRLLFAYLVVNRGRPAGRDELIDVLWEGRPPEAPGPALSSLLARLRRVFGHDLLAGRTHLSLALPADAWIDTEAAAQAASEAEVALDGDDLRGALERARAALDLIERPLLAEFDAGWIDEQRRAIDDLRSELLDTAARAALGLGPAELATAERAARALIECEPYRESGYALLMEANARRGDVAEALRVFDSLRVLLRDELGATPAARVTALHERLLRDGELAVRTMPVPEALADVPMPPLLARTEQRQFVGRGDELERLRGRWREASGGQGGIVVLTGDAGMGKTRLAARFAAEVHAGGGLVLYGRADEETVVAYQPFVEALRHYAAHRPGLDTEPSAAPHLDELAPLVPELPGVASPRREKASGERDYQRYHLFEAVTGLLTHAARNRPLLLVLEDLHWADKPTLLLLRHLVRQAEGSPLLLVGSYRDVEVASSDPVARLLADLRRDQILHRVSLPGLDDEETAALVSTRGGDAPDAVLVRRLRAHTGGNPFFIEETLRGLAETHGGHGALSERAVSAMGVPEGVKEVIGQRFERLSPAAAEALTIAAVLGRDFRLAPLEALAPDCDGGVIRTLEEALDSGLVMEHPEEVDRFSFCHALVRETLYERLTASRRGRIHLRAGETLEAARESLAIQPAELAHHFFHARQVGGADKAITYAVEAAVQAVDAHAYEEAAHHYERALAALELARPADEAARCDLLLALGAVRWQASEPGARAPFEQAAEIARRMRFPERLAQAALGAGGRFYAPVVVDRSYVALLDEALDALDPADHPARVRLMARLAENLAVADPTGRAKRLAVEAVEMARRVDDADALATALMSRHAALLHADHVEERVRDGHEALALARGLGAPALAALANHWLLYDAFELGDLEEAQRRQAELEVLAGELRQPLYRHSALAWRGVRAQLAGRFEEAERLARESLRLAERAGTKDAGRHFTAQLFAVRREQGRLAELRSDIATLVDRGPTGLTWQTALVLAHLDAGDTDEAVHAYERIAAGGFDAIPRSMFWLTVVAWLGEAAAALDDVARAGELYRLLLPHAELLVQTGFTGCSGSVHRFLGVLSAAMSDRDGACAHFEAACARHRALGARPLLARTECAYAELLLAGEEPREADRGLELLSGARQAAEELGMSGLARELSAVR